jgi:hypothetical protein
MSKKLITLEMPTFTTLENHKNRTPMEVNKLTLEKVSVTKVMETLSTLEVF